MAVRAVVRALCDDGLSRRDERPLRENEAPENAFFHEPIIGKLEITPIVELISFKS